MEKRLCSYENKLCKYCISDSDIACNYEEREGASYLDCQYAKKYDLKCANAFQFFKNPLKNIVCLKTNKKCVCSSCTNDAIGFKMNPCVVDCPAFKTIE